MAKREKTHTTLEKLALILIVLCIVLVVIYQVQSFVAIVFPEQTPTPVQVAPNTNFSSMPVEMEDVLPTFTPTADPNSP